jgi:2'-5' RNA ligase
MISETNEKHALWYMPSGEVYNRLKNIIVRLSEKYSTPAFEPHVTVIGGLKDPLEELCSKSAQVADLIRPHRIGLIGPECLDEFYRCLFLRAEKTAELTLTHLEAERIFGRTGESEYSPHLSLMYCDFIKDIKEQIIPEIGEWDPVFEVDRICLYSTEGEPTEWKPVQSFTLNSSLLKLNKTRH